ncbi:MAG: hypothetical protein H8D23_06940 [Candidatus Brocadiales bacterium]|nr:hypothetical protein [Candidatus Brocadiales bacterium]
MGLATGVGSYYSLIKFAELARRAAMIGATIAGATSTAYTAGSSGDSGGGGSGGLGSTARNTGSATLHYWAPGGDGSKNGYHGHVSLTLDDGTYISYWPDVGRYGHPKGGIYVFYWMPARTADYDKDLEGEVIGHH